MTIQKVLGLAVGSSAIPGFEVPIAIVVWLHFVMALLCPWTCESQEIWAALLGYRVYKAYLCKNRSGNEHEFIVVDLINEQNQELRLRVERAAGGRRDSRSRSLSPGRMVAEPDDFLHDSPLLGSPSRGRRSSSSSTTSGKGGGITRAANSLHHIIRTLSRLPGIMSNMYLAEDTVVRIDSIPHKAKIARTVEFNSTPHSQRPSLWDLMILVDVIHEDSCFYELLDRQCFWFADSISAILEEWSKRCEGASVRVDAPSGCVKGFAVLRRKREHVEKIWAQFTNRKDMMNKERQGYEYKRQKEVARTEELEKQVEELKKQQERERQEREKEVREWKETERRLRNVQVETERQLMRRIVDQQQQLAEKDRECKVFAQQREREGHLHFQVLVQC